MKILKNVQKIPGGLMVVPLLAGAMVNTFTPDILQVGGFVTALFKSGGNTLVALSLLCNGAQIEIKRAGEPLLKGVLLTAVKFALGVLMGILIGKIFGPAGGVLGIAPLAVISAMTNSNGGMFTALTTQYGGPGDVCANALLAINDGPFLTLVAFGATGMASIPINTLIICIVPVVIGFILGNIDEDLREFLKVGIALIIPFFAFNLGAGINLTEIYKAGISGLILGVLTTLITGFGGYLAMKAIRSKTPAAGAAIGTTAGNAVATPAFVAETDPSLAEVAGIATVQTAASVVVTAILCPLLVSFLDKKEKQIHTLKEETK